MDYVIQSLTDWLKEILITGILGNLGDLFAEVRKEIISAIGQLRIH